MPRSDRGAVNDQLSCVAGRGTKRTPVGRSVTQRLRHLDGSLAASVISQRHPVLSCRVGGATVSPRRRVDLMVPSVRVAVDDVSRHAAPPAHTRSVASMWVQRQPGRASLLPARPVLRLLAGPGFVGSGRWASTISASQRMSKSVCVSAAIIAGVIRGVHPDGVVTVVSVQWFGSEAVELTYKTPSGAVANELLYRHDEDRLELVAEGRPWSFDGDGALVPTGVGSPAHPARASVRPAAGGPHVGGRPAAASDHRRLRGDAAAASRCASSSPTTRGPARPSWRGS